MGIAKALIDFAFDRDTGEGSHSALAKAERWRDVVEEMLEVADKEQSVCLFVLHGAIGAAIGNIVLNTTIKG